MTLDASPSTEPLLAAIATELQALPANAAPRPVVAASTMNLNAQVAAAGRALLAMEDHPGSFEPWCRAFAQEGPDR